VNYHYALYKEYRKQDFVAGRLPQPSKWRKKRGQVKTLLSRLIYFKRKTEGWIK